MKKLTLGFLLGSLTVFTVSFSQTIKLDANNLVPNQVYMSIEKWDGKQAVNVIKDSTLQAVDEATFVRIKDMDFKDGIIEVNVLSRLHKKARP